MNTTKTLIAAALTSAGFAIAPLASASPIAISPSPTVTSGSLTFDNFTCSIFPGTLTCDGIGVASYVSTTPPDPVAGDNGITIQSDFNGLPNSEDVTITYDATTSVGAITDAEMYFNGTPVSSVAEQIYNLADDHLIGSLLVQSPGAGTEMITLSEPATSIYVVKDIGLSASPDATISKIDQTFSITVPEPGTFALFGAALLGGTFWLRRRRASIR